MLILGSHVREIELSTGQFHCPNCDARRAYKRKRIGKYFTLYFIPLFQFENMGERVVCQTCQQAYTPEALAHKPPSLAEKVLRAARSELETGLPLHTVQQKLIAAGMAQEAADKIVQAAAGAQVKCSKCGFSYLGTVKFCTHCGTNLTA